MTADQILAPLSELVNRLLNEPAANATVDEIVDELRTLLQETGRRLAGTVLARAAAPAQRPFCPGCQVPCRRRGTRPRSLVTLLGEVHLAVPRFRCAGCGWEAPCGLLVRSGGQGCSTPAVAEIVGRLAAKLPFRETEAVVRELAGIRLSDNTCARLAERLGGEVERQQAVTAQRVMAWEQTLRAETAPERLYLLVDGRSVKVEGRWRELKVGVCFRTTASELDARGQPPPGEQLRVCAHLGGADDFFARFTATAQASGLLDAREVVLIADGADWIWQRLPDLVPLGVKSVEILDYDHAAQHVQQAVNEALGESTPAAARLGEQWRRWLWAGSTAAVMTGLRRLAADHQGREAGRVAKNALAYLHRHRGRFGYQERWRDGYHTGSGAVESQCKQLGQRFKGPGMDWSERGLAAIVALYCRIQNAPELPLALAA